MQVACGLYVPVRSLHRVELCSRHASGERDCCARRWLFVSPSAMFAEFVLSKLVAAAGVFYFFVELQKE